MYVDIFGDFESLFRIIEYELLSKSFRCLVGVNSSLNYGIFDWRSFECRFLELFEYLFVILSDLSKD